MTTLESSPAVPSRSAIGGRAPHIVVGRSTCDHATADCIPVASIGLSPDAGWELDVACTLPCAPEEAWDRLLSEWLPRWLSVDSIPLAVGAPLQDGGRARGRIIGCSMHRRISARWTPATLDHETALSVMIEPAEDECTVVTLHQERLLGAAESHAQLDQWTSRLSRLHDELAAERRDLRSADPAN